MAKLDPLKHDRASVVTASSFTAAGQAGAWHPIRDAANALLSGAFDAECRLECSFDGGTTAIPLTDDAGAIRLFVAPERVIVEELEPGVLIRWKCTAFVSGPVVHRISR